MVKRNIFVWSMLAALLFISTAALYRHPTPAVSAIETPFPCPTVTPVYFNVDFHSPTELLTQTLRVTLQEGERITVTAPTGIYTETSVFLDAPITVDLLADTENQMQASGLVREINPEGPCPTGGYTLTRNFSIVQQSPSATPEPSTHYLPFFAR